MSHSARLLTSDLIAAADLVLTATREHRRAVVSFFPRSAMYAYTLTQLARLIDELPVSEPDHPEYPRLPNASTYRFLQILDEIAESRGTAAPPLQPEVDDIPDPYRRSQSVYDRVGALINAAMTVIATHLVEHVTALSEQKYPQAEPGFSAV